MERQAVASSSIRSVGYEPEDRTLEIEFINGSVYAYLDVPSEVHEELLAAESRGQFVNFVIKKRFAFRRLR